MNKLSSIVLVVALVSTSYAHAKGGSSGGRGFSSSRPASTAKYAPKTSKTSTSKPSLYMFFFGDDEDEYQCVGGKVYNSEDKHFVKINGKSVKC